MPGVSELSNAIRVLSIDAVQRAKSGHPGMPMGMADIAQVLWAKWLNHNPSNPDWVNRDRFVVSNGHGSMLLYSLLHLTGYDLSIDDLKDFRQFHSKTAGHPEVHETPGVETTTGPLGQGIANAVGMALAEKLLAQKYNQESHEIIDHHTYAFMGDGCLMEGISHEVCSLAGSWGLGKLIAFWDDNGISIDGEITDWYGDNTGKRFEAYGWNVIGGVDGHDPEAINEAIKKAHAQTTKPTLICCKTTIGFGSPNVAGSAKSHGAPLGAEEIALTREALGWKYPAFEIPQDIYQAWDAKDAGQQKETTWQTKWQAYEAAHPKLAKELSTRLAGNLPDNWQALTQAMIEDMNSQAKTVGSRKSSQACINHLAPKVASLLGGSADLTGSNNTDWSGAKSIASDSQGDYVHYGVREFGMSAIMNGLALHGGFIPFGGTFLVFSDYARNAVRMSAMMSQKVIYVFSHDSIGLGEDGPTHQPIEHTASLRLIPNLNVWRPCDGVETAVAWQQAVEYQGPSALLFSRQNVAHQTRDEQTINEVQCGGYVLHEATAKLNAIIIATGSEVQIAMEVARQRDDVRVVSMPCVEVFLQQDADYQEYVLPTAVDKRIAIEAGVSDGWYRFVGSQGTVLGINTFGMSAPFQEVYDYFGLNSQGLDSALDAEHASLSEAVEVAL